MAIVKMNKFSLVGFNNDKKALVDLLEKMGVVELKGFSDTELTEEFESLLKSENDDDNLQQLEQELKRASAAVKIVDEAAQIKKPLFFSRRTVSQDEYDKQLSNVSETKQILDKVLAANDTIGALTSEINKLKSDELKFIPWQNLGFDISVSQTEFSQIAVGTISVKKDFEQLKSKIEGVAGVIETVNTDKTQRYIYAAVHNDDADTVFQALSDAGFSQTTFGEYRGTPGDILKSIQKEKDDKYSQIEKLKKELAAFAKQIHTLEMYHDYLTELIAKSNAYDKFAHTESAFLIRGYLPSDAADEVFKKIGERFDVYFETQPCGDDEDHPILLKNNKLVSPFETVTETYSIPSYQDVDPNAVMMPFYFLFFGLMLSDAAYGILLSIGSWILLKKYHPEGTSAKMLKMFCICGVSTVFWGIMFGGWFGDIIPALTGVESIALWFDPIKDPMKLLLWSFGFGIVHMFAGLGVKAYMLIKKGKWLDAVFDIGLWYLLILGIIMLLFGSSIGEGVKKAGLYATVAGVVGLILTQGRAEKKIYMKLFKGVASLYDIVGYMSDVLSYSRLLALGLATGVIASVMNTMGLLGGKSFFGMVLFAVVFIVGHVFNLAVSLLSAYVHTSRLQYVEFFGKFYIGGGKLFAPVKADRKYTRLQR